MMNTDHGEKPILHLNLKLKWFNMILSGIKKEEYRIVGSYWSKRLAPYIKIYPSTSFDIIICFSNGYSKDRKQFKIECKGLKVSYGRQEWGAEPNILYYIFLLGDILSIK